MSAVLQLKVKDNELISLLKPQQHLIKTKRTMWARNPYMGSKLESHSNFPFSQENKWTFKKCNHYGLQNRNVGGKHTKTQKSTVETHARAQKSVCIVALYP